MIRPARFVAALVLASPIAVAAQQPFSAAAATGAVKVSEIDGHLRFLSHDVPEERAPATPQGVAQ
jgi:hypothetical protein